MTTSVQRRRGSTVQHSTFTGLEGEITIDTTKDTAVVHDGSTVGGFPLAKENLANANTTALTAIIGTDTASDDTFLIYDASAGVMKKITRAELNNAIEVDALSNVTITGGTINGTSVGATTASTGKFTTLESSSTTTLNGTSIPTSKTLLVSTDIGTSVQGYDATILKSANIGSTVQAYDAQLADVAGLTPTDNGVIIGNGTNFVVESGATLRTSLGLAIGTNVQAYDADLTTLGAGGSSARTFLGLGTGDSPTFTTQTLSGNIVFTGTGNRITGDFSNATEANKVSFQTSTTNGNTAITAIPNGTAVIANFQAWNNSTPTAASGINMLVNATETSLRANIMTSGTYLPITMYTGGSERLRIDTSGNVGIGTSTTTYKTNIVYTNSAGGVAETGLYLRNTATGNSTQMLFDGYRSWSMLVQGSFGAPAGGFTIQDNTAGANRLSIDSSGNVGIGTNSPSTKFHVASAGATTTYALVGNQNGAGFLGVASSGEARLASFGVGSTLQFGHSDVSTFTERMRIDSSGNLLVGTTSVSVPGIGFAFQIQGASSTASQFVVGHATGAASGTGFGYFQYNGSAIGSITQNGTTAVLYNITSDVRVKENIVDAPSSLAKINSVKVRSFDFKSDGSHVDFGVIAQELYEVAPEAVSKGDDGETIKTTWGVDTSVLVPAMIKAIQELNAKVESLEAQLKGK